MKKKFKNLKTLRPHKHKIDFFIADELKLSSFRDEMASMEHPFFALKAGDTKDREYKKDNIVLTIRSNSFGLATIFDKDVWIYSISKLQEAINNKKKISKTIIFTPYDFFITTNRNTGGRAYEDLKKALSRLSGTRIETNIFYSPDRKESINFGLIDSWQILEEKKGLLDIGMVKIILPDWLYQALYKNKILKISSDYFRIRKAIDRRLYEIARKHCGTQFKFSISLNKLHAKTGSSMLLKMFRHKIKQLSIVNDLPDYNINYNSKIDNVIFVNRHFDKKKDFCISNKYKKKYSLKKFFIKNSEIKFDNNLKCILKIPEGFK